MSDDLYLCWCIFSTFISIYVWWFFSPRNKKFSDEEKMIIVTSSLGSPFLIPLLSILLWVLFFRS